MIICPKCLGRNVRCSKDQGIIECECLHCGYKWIMLTMRGGGYEWN